MFKVNNRNIRKGCERYWKLPIKTPERRHWRRSGVFIVNFEHILHLFLVFLLLHWTNKCYLGNFLVIEYNLPQVLESLLMKEHGIFLLWLWLVFAKLHTLWLKRTLGFVVCKFEIENTMSCRNSETLEIRE